MEFHFDFNHSEEKNPIDSMESEPRKSFFSSFLLTGLISIKSRYNKHAKRISIKANKYENLFSIFVWIILCVITKWAENLIFICRFSNKFTKFVYVCYVFGTSTSVSILKWNMAPNILHFQLFVLFACKTEWIEHSSQTKTHI